MIYVQIGGYISCSTTICANSMRLFTYTASEQYCKRCKEKVLLFDCLSFRWRVSAKWAVCNIVRSLHGQVILLTELNSTNIAHICSLGKIHSNHSERSFRCHCPCLACLTTSWFCTFCQSVPFFSPTAASNQFQFITYFERSWSVI